MGFVKFTEVGKNFIPKLTITPAGVISFNQGARKKFDLDLYSHIIMYMDADEHTIGFELVNNEDLDGANKIRHIRRDGVDINARAFLKHFKLKLKRSLLFDLGQDAKTGWLIMRLDEGEILGMAPTQGPTMAPLPARPSSTNRDDNVSTQSASVTAQPGTKSPAVAAMKTLANAVPANASTVRSNQTQTPEAQVATRTRGVKAMLSELLQD